MKENPYEIYLSIRDAKRFLPNQLLQDVGKKEIVSIDVGRNIYIQLEKASQEKGITIDEVFLAALENGDHFHWQWEKEI